MRSAPASRPASVSREGSRPCERARQREEQLRVAAEAKVLDGEVSRVKQLVAERQAVQDDLTQLTFRQATASALAAAKPRTMGLFGKQIEIAEQRRKSVREGQSVLSRKIEASLLVAERNLEMLRRRREGYSLRASYAGRVAAITRQPGDIVESSAPILRIVASQHRVIACIPERASLGIHEGDSAQLHIKGQSGSPLHGKAVALSPLVTELPSRCWPSARVPVWGREVTVVLDDPMELVPGQAFDIHFEASPLKGPPPAAASGSSAPAPVSAMLIVLPKALSARTRFEPSGILAQGAQARYLVVSDDTGTGEDGDEDQPWIFAMSANGAVHAEPVIVGGVREIKDVEAIAAGAGGEVYLLSSQSYSKKGKRKPARTALLRLRPEGQGFQVSGEAHLAEQLDADPELAAQLGLSGGTAALDIEGMALRDGALFLGLKAPLDARGEAMIWKVASPAALFDAPGTKDGGRDGAKGLKSAGVSLWATARIDVDLGGQPVPGGISDLLFLPGGELAITSTPSTADGDTGALWVVDKPNSGKLTPRLIERFPGRKPEGIAPSLSGDKLMIVFDTGDAAPLYQEVQWTH